MTFTIGNVETSGTSWQDGKLPGVLAGLRPYVAGDLGKIGALLQASRGLPAGLRQTPEDLLTRWTRWQVNPETDINVLPGEGDDIVALSRATLITDPTRRLSLEIDVLPAWRERGVGTALYTMISERARQLQAPHMTSPVQLLAGQERTEGTAFLERRGFFPDRSYWQMRLDNLCEQPHAQWPPEFTYRPFNLADRECDAEKWARLIRVAFLEPASTSRVLAQFNEPGSGPQGYIFAVEKATGQEVGTSRARLDTQAGERVGYIGTVGVLPEYRNRGIASALILQTLEYFKEQGINSATLFVEGGNHNARSLYAHMGWRTTFRTVHYWKTLA